MITKRKSLGARHPTHHEVITICYAWKIFVTIASFLDKCCHDLEFWIFWIFSCFLLDLVADFFQSGWTLQKQWKWNKTGSRLQWNRILQRKKKMSNFDISTFMSLFEILMEVRVNKKVAFILRILSNQIESNMRVFVKYREQP